MPRRTTVRWINSPVEQVFAHVRDLRGYLQLVPHIRVVDWLPDDATNTLAVGGTGVLRAGRRELLLRISTYVENHLLELEVTGLGSITYERLELESAMGGTRIIHTTETVVLADPQGRKRLPPMQRALDHMLGLIKEVLEAPSRALQSAIIIPDNRLLTPVRPRRVAA